jgi:16S rRNA (adenine1518-N6/adenine1519-N6)-dimethyltransferase
VKKEYGQHFLRDPNILAVIGRLGELEPDDVVLEIGPGQGVLTRYLADRVRRVYAIEIDRALEPDLSGLPANVDLVFSDALQIELPQDATKLVANLPYNVATPLIVESLDGLPNVRLWCVMVLREVADRLCAGLGT